MTYLFPVSSRPTVNFLEALAAAGSTLTPPFIGTAINNLYGVPNTASRRFLIRAIQYLAVENVGLEFDFYASATSGVAAIGTDTFIARYQFASVNGVQYNSAGIYQYYVDGLTIPYVDADWLGSSAINQPLLHVGVQNIDTVAKSADAAGAIATTFWLEPMTGVQG